MFIWTASIRFRLIQFAKSSLNFHFALLQFAQRCEQNMRFCIERMWRREQQGTALSDRS